MIKGLIALITSGILLNPMVILGIICGTYIMSTFSESAVLELFKNAYFYEGMFAVAFLFAFFFEKEYTAGGKKINWKAIAGIAFGRFITLLITVFIVCLCIFSITFGNQAEEHKVKAETIKVNEIIFK